MTVSAAVPPPGADTRRRGLGTSPTAGAFLVLVGLLHVVQGVVALVNETFLALRVEYLFKFDMTTWGWVHLVAGVVVVAAGAGLFYGAVWARLVALVLASLSILGSFLWLPFNLFGSMTIIFLDLMVIWAVTAHGRGVFER